MKQPPHLQIRRSARAKRLRLAVKPGLIELVIPHGIEEAQAIAFLNKHRTWAEDKLLEMNKRAISKPTVPSFSESATIPWRGREIPLLIREGAGLRVSVAVDDSVCIALPRRLSGNRDDIAKRALYIWVQRWLHTQVSLLSEHHAPLHGLYPREIRIKRMKTRWGSCGPRGDINMNWLLAFAPEDVLEYVVVHELCHIRERNHSQAFWSLVASHFPDYAQQRQWLRSHGAELMRRFSL